MAGIDQTTLAAAVAKWGNGTVEILDSGSRIQTVTPEAWWPVAQSLDPEERKRTALSLWNAEFLELVPRFAEALGTALVDVRVAQHSWQDTPTLDYVLRAWDDELKVWMGEDPRTFGPSEPPMFDSLPVPTRTFLRQVHAGFTTLNGKSCGLMRPSDMGTLADTEIEVSAAERVADPHWMIFTRLTPADKQRIDRQLAAAAPADPGWISVRDGRVERLTFSVPTPATAYEDVVRTIHAVEAGPAHPVNLTWVWAGDQARYDEPRWAGMTFGG